MARSDILEHIMRPILDLMQTMPSFVYLIPALMLFGLGKVRLCSQHLFMLFRLPFV